MSQPMRFKYISTFFVDGKTVMVDSELVIDNDKILRALSGRALASKASKATAMRGAVVVKVSNRRTVG